jgi:hypothetical protein
MSATQMYYGVDFNAEQVQLPHQYPYYVSQQISE